MEINSLLKHIRHQEEEPKTFLALELTDDIVQAAVWRVRDAKTEVVKIGTPEYWNGTGHEDKLLEAVDKTLGKAVEGLGQEPEQVVFGLPHNWVKEDDIVPDKKDLIKKITKELDLKPLGFVVLIESLIRYLKIREGTPATAIIVHVTDTEVTVSLVKLGKVIGTHTIGRSEDISHDVEEGISRNKIQETLPSRIIVFNGTQDMEEIVQNLTSYDWQNKFDFLHVPKIESLPKDAGISAVAVAGGSEVAKAIGFDIDFDEDTKPTLQDQAKATEEVSPPQDTESDLEDLGFVEGKDIAQLQKKEQAPIRRDMQEKKQEQEEPEPQAPSPRAAPLAFIGLLFTKLKSFKFPKFSKSLATKFPKGPFALGIAILLGLFAIVFAVLWFVPKTEITLYLEPKNLEQSLDLTISQRVSEPNRENNVIPGRSVSKSVSGDKTVETTGIDTVGDPARGEVTIYNRTSLEKTFPEGTVISADNLDFTLDSSVTIASKSSGSDYSEVPGKASVAVTAADIGEDSNLPANTEFTIASFSTESFIAKNDDSLTGGTSQEVRVVAESDEERVLSELTRELEEKAKTELMAEASGETGVLIQEELTEVTKEDYSASEGEEAQSLSLNLEITTHGLTYNKKDVENLVSDNVEGNMPPGYQKADLPIGVETSITSATEDEVILDATIQVKLLPTVENEALASTIKGMKATELESIFKNVPNFKRAEVSIQPTWLPPRWKKVSRNPANIIINIRPI